MKNRNVIEGFGCRQEAWAEFTVYSSFLQLDTGAGLTKNGAVAQISATGIGIPKSRRIGRQHCGYFFVRRHGTPSYGRAVWGSASCAGSLTRYANPHGSAHPRLASGRRKLSTAVKEIIAMSGIKTPAKGKSAVTPKTPTKGKSLATPKKPTRRTLPAPTPESIHALFVAMRTLGWRSGREHTHFTRRPPPASVPVNAATPLPTEDQIEVTFMAARELDRGPISREEEFFLDKLMRDIRYLSLEEIEHVEMVAACIQKKYPWEPSFAERCAGTFTGHYSTRDLPQVSPATPRERAMFAVLRNVGIYAAQDRNHAPLLPPTLPDPEARIKPMSKAWRCAANALSNELGWWYLNPREVGFLYLLRQCNDRGRDILEATVGAILSQHRQREMG